MNALHPESAANGGAHVPVFTKRTGALTARQLFDIELSVLQLADLLAGAAPDGSSTLLAGKRAIVAALTPRRRNALRRSQALLGYYSRQVAWQHLSPVVIAAQVHACLCRI
ncbi:hypothetical protein GCM10023187_20940 [Nibrella viscosa]|uniref:Uncharacterized protein n=1 Tax=Nibrella viscosa TaxID=1084524 RepID=A0ABP8KCV6_9BACT